MNSRQQMNATYGIQGNARCNKRSNLVRPFNHLSSTWFDNINRQSLTVSIVNRNSTGTFLVNSKKLKTVRACCPSSCGCGNILTGVMILPPTIFNERNRPCISPTSALQAGHTKAQQCLYPQKAVLACEIFCPQRVY